MGFGHEVYVSQSKSVVKLNYKLLSNKDSPGFKKIFSVFIFSRLLTFILCFLLCSVLVNMDGSNEHADEADIGKNVIFPMIMPLQLLIILKAV